MVESGQVRILSDYRDLLMGEGTVYDLQSEVNPFIRGVRAPQTGPRPYAHGSYTGAEWQNEAVVPIRVIANGDSKDVPSTRAAIQAMSAGFAAIGNKPEVIGLYFRLDGDPDEYVMFGTTRGFEPDLATMGEGWVYASASFVAQDPRVYSAAEASVSTGLAVQTGGLTVPVTAPVAVTGRLIGGRGLLTNSGTAAAPLTARIDGPVVEPGFVLYSPDGSIQSVRFSLTLLDGQWLEIDSATHTALLNGAETANRRPDATWLLDDYPIQPGLTRVRFVSGAYNEAAELTVTARSAWW